MARQTITTTTYTDDLDGSKAEGTISFGFEGVNYEIDLSKPNARAFERAMSLYVGHARKVRNSRSRANGRRAASSNGHDSAAVREWAKSNGYDVSHRGRVASAVVDAYDAAH